MTNIGVVKYKNVGSIDLKDLKQIDIKDIVIGGYNVQVYPHDDRTYCLLFVDVNYNYILTRVIMDSETNIISPSITINSYNTSYPIYRFKKYKNSIFVNYYNNNCHLSLSKLNIDLSIVNTVNINYCTPFLSANDAHVYTYYNNQLFIYNNELQFLKKVGQSNDTTGAFYLPTNNIKQFESHKGMYYWLNNTNLQILREDNGQLVKSVAVNANNFIIDSSDNVVLINNTTKELNYFTADGTLVDQTPLDNYTADLRLSLTIDGQPLFYSDTSICF